MSRTENRDASPNEDRVFLNFISFKSAMKGKGLLMIVLGFFALGDLNRGQEPPVPVLVDEYGALPCDDLLSRWDAFYTDLSENPNSTGLISIATAPEKRRDVSAENPVLL